MIFCLAVGILLTYVLTPSYRAKIVLEVLAINQDFMNNKDIDPNMSSSRQMDAYLETEMRLL